MKITLTYPSVRTGRKRIVAHWPPSDVHAEASMSKVVGTCTRRDPRGPWVAELDSRPESVVISRFTLNELRDAVFDYLREHGKWWQ